MSDISAVMTSKILDCGANLPLSARTEAIYWMCRNEAMIHELRAEVERLRVRERHLCRELARLALDYVTTQDEAHAELDEQQLAAEMIAFADSL